MMNNKRKYALNFTTTITTATTSRGDLPNSRSNPGLPQCRQILYQLSHKGSQDTSVGSLTLLQQIFLTQESNWDLLHCRWILYQLRNTY